jgi:hypothetical protein
MGKAMTRHSNVPITEMRNVRTNVSVNGAFSASE